MRTGVVARVEEDERQGGEVDVPQRGADVVAGALAQDHLDALRDARRGGGLEQLLEPRFAVADLLPVHLEHVAEGAPRDLPPEAHEDDVGPSLPAARRGGTAQAGDDVLRVRPMGPLGVGLLRRDVVEGLLVVEHVAGGPLQDGHELGRHRRGAAVATGAPVVSRTANAVRSSANASPWRTVATISYRPGPGASRAGRRSRRSGRRARGKEYASFSNTCARSLDDRDRPGPAGRRGPRGRPSR